MIKTFEIQCDNCEKIVTEVMIYPDGENEENPRPTLKSSGLGWLFSATSYDYNKKTLLHISKLIDEKKFREFAEIDHDTFGFFCQKCSRNYCVSCWKNIATVFDDGFYDYTSANCPFGHKQDIAD